MQVASAGAAAADAEEAAAEARAHAARFLRRSRHPIHVGVWLDVDGGGVLHCAEGAGVVFQRSDALALNGWAIEGFYPPVPLDVLGEIDRLRALWIERRFGAAMAEHGIAVRRFEQREAKRLDIMSRYDKSEAGYVAFLIDRYPALARFLHSPVPVQVEEDCRRRHTYITGKSGCGKSELIKQFAHAYITGTAPQASIVVIDPHGELAEEIASLRDVPEDRLVYFEPAVDLSLFPVVNPFHSPHIERARSDEERKYLITHHAETIVEGMRAMLGADLTDNMETVLLHCICTILQVRDGSLLDLQEMVAPRKNPSDRQRHLIQVGRE
ncbi:MAG: DUF87 domain-containing protein [Magnetospirillum sp.]|nr:MAG: DUF87 domain-containing protein [Magnetospirillum sp.]